MSSASSNVNSSSALCWFLLEIPDGQKFPISKFHYENFLLASLRVTIAVCSTVFRPRTVRRCDWPTAASEILRAWRCRLAPQHPGRVSIVKPNSTQSDTRAKPRRHRGRAKRRVRKPCRSVLPSPSPIGARAGEPEPVSVWAKFRLKPPPVRFIASLTYTGSRRTSVLARAIRVREPVLRTYRRYASCNPPRIRCPGGVFRCLCPRRTCNPFARTAKSPSRTRLARL